MPKMKTDPKKMYSQRLTQQAIDMLEATSQSTGLPASAIIEAAIRLYVMTYQIQVPNQNKV